MVVKRYLEKSWLLTLRRIMRPGYVVNRNKRTVAVQKCETAARPPGNRADVWKPLRLVCLEVFWRRFWALEKADSWIGRVEFSLARGNSVSWLWKLLLHCFDFYWKNAVRGCMSNTRFDSLPGLKVIQDIWYRHLVDSAAGTFMVEDWVTEKGLATHPHCQGQENEIANTSQKNW